MPEEPYTPAELEAAASAIGTARHVIASDGYPSIRIGTDEEEARFALDAAAPLIDARVRAEERARIDAALRAMPCPDPERPGARVTADDHYRWMTEVLRVVAATPDAGPGSTGEVADA